MLDIKLIRQSPNLVKEGLEKRGFDSGIVDEILSLDDRRRYILRELEDNRAEVNRKSKTIPNPVEIEKLQKLKEKIKEYELELNESEGKIKKIIYQIPNIPLKDVPAGGEEKSIVLRKWGEPPEFNFEVKDHLEIGETLDLIDVKRAAKVSGTRFAYLKKDAVLLEFALINFAIKMALKDNFIPIIPPVLIPEGITESLGYWARGGNENYYSVYEPRCRWCNHEIKIRELGEVLCRECIDDNNPYGKSFKQIISADGKAVCHNCGKENRSPFLFLIGTAEHSIAPMHSHEIFEETELPKRYIGFSTAFRREAGSYGKDTRGILRVHQFDKLELFSFCHPSKSEEELKFLVEFEEKMWQLLKIPYQVVQLAAGDLSHPSAATIDIEAWMPGQNRYREVTSASTTTDFQARDFNIRFRKKDRKLEYVHMLNATGFAIGRTLVAILENYQQKDGSIKIPKALKKYLV